MSKKAGELTGAALKEKIGRNSLERPAAISAISSRSYC
jgi:hypothetical protein